MRGLSGFSLYSLLTIDLGVASDPPSDDIASPGRLHPLEWLALELIRLFNLPTDSNALQMLP